MLLSSLQKGYVLLVYAYTKLHVDRSDAYFRTFFLKANTLEAYEALENI